MEEKRLHPRLALPLQAEFVVEGEERRGTLQNLSAGGAALRFPEYLQPGSRLEHLRFELPPSGRQEGYRVVVDGEVVHSEPLRQPAGEGGFLSGIRFIELPLESFKRIQQFIYERLTKGSPMPAEMPIERRRLPVQKPIAMRFERFDDFVSEVSENISAGGMFIRTHDPQVPGSIFAFQFRLGDDFSLIEGRAEVVWTRRRSLGPERPAGMGVRFLELEEASRKTILQLIEQTAAREHRDAPASADLRVAAVFPRRAARQKRADPARQSAASRPSPILVPASRPSPLRSVAAAAAAPVAAAGSEVEKLQHELGRRTEAYEARIRELEGRIGKLTADNAEIAQRQAATTDAAKTLEELRHEHRRRTQAYEERVRELEARTAELAAKGADTEQQPAAPSGSDKELEKLCAALEKQLQVAQESLGELARERDDLNSRLEAGEAELETMREKSQAARDQVAAERRARSGLDNRLLAVEQALRQTESERDKLKEKLKQNAAAQGGAAAADAARAKIEQLESDLAAAAATRQDLEEKAAAREEEREEMERQLAELQGIAAARRENEAADEEERQELQKALETARAEVEAAHADGMRLAAELRGQLEAAKVMNAELESRLGVLEEDRDDAERDLGVAREEANKEGQRAERAEEAARELEKALETARQESEAVHQESERRAAEHQAEITKADEASRVLQQRIEELEGERAELERRLTGEIEAIDMQRERVSAVEAERLEMEEVLQAVRDEAAAEREMREQLALKVAEVEGTLADSDSESEEVQETIAALEERERESREALTRVEEEIAALETESARRLAAVEDRFRSSEDVNAELREEISVLGVEAEELRRERQILETQARARDEELRRRLEEVRSHEEEAREKLDAERSGSRERYERLQELEAGLATEREATAEMAAELEAAQRRETEAREALESAVSAGRERDERVQVLEATLAAEREQRVALMADVEAELQTQELHSDKGGQQGLDSDFELQPRAPAAASAPTGTTESDETLPAGGGLRAASIAGIGIVLAALLWGGWRFIGSSGGEPGGMEPAPQVVESPEEVALPAAEDAAVDPASVTLVEEIAAREPLPEAPPPPPPAETVHAWADAWAGQRADEYLAFYGRDFVPPDGATRSEWEAFRRQRVESPPWIRITVADLAEERLASERVAVSFEQAYTAGAYSDKVRKTLVLVVEGNAWKIAEETSTPL